ncbi:glycerophosphoryl diester phosphodiesterase [Enterococcus sp. AZ091]|uniref:glycerophosphodiester phosphodiesterase n=1 Tax=Enterococcus TaxID=1350 RepID=UPI002090502D|nr:glycerophosphodiester phosphodiesterase [Enterococcus gallinarum]MCO5478202.1 glycerophosphodiester phosphodiesterase [Enterococcus gallinarum]
MHRKKIKKTKILIPFLIFLVILSSVVTFYLIKNTNDSSSRVYSHRGASGEEIEHTVAAYDLAILYGSRYIEQDLVTSRDNTLYVSHDLSAKRITGVDKLFVDMTDDEISDLRTEDNEKILSLQDVFNRYGNTVNYVIELKENSNQTKLFEDLVKKNNLEDNIVVQASDIKPLQDLSKSFPNMPKLLLVKNQSELEKAVTYDIVDIVSAEKSMMTKENVKLVHGHKKLLNIWTINSTSEIKKAINLGIDNYFTNFTAKALALENKYRK